MKTILVLAGVINDDVRVISNDVERGMYDDSYSNRDDDDEIYSYS